MSVQNVTTFAKKLEDSETLQNQVKALTPGDSAGLLKLAVGLGFDFSIQELQDVIAQAGELNDEQLDQVAGGVDVSQTAGRSSLLALGSFCRKAGERPLEY